MKRIIAILICWATAAQAQIKISELPAASSVSGTDTGLVVQGGATKQFALSLLSGLYQPLDTDLTALASLSGTNTIYYRSAADTWTAVTIGANLTFAAGTLSASGGGGGGSGDMLASNNLSDLTDFAAARTNLGGTTVGVNLFMLSSPSAVRYIRINANDSIDAITAATLLAELDSDLVIYAGITPSANVQSFLGAANYSAMRTQLSLVPGVDVLAPTGSGAGLSGINFSQLSGAATDAQVPNNITASNYQLLDSDLTAIAALTTTAAGLALLDDADAAAQRVTLGGVVTSGELDTANELSTMIGGQTTGSGNFVRSSGATINDSRRTVQALGNLSGSSSVDFTTGGSWKTATAIGNVTFSNITLSAGSVGILTFTQDATGSRAITWPASVVTPLPTISSTANSSTVITFSTHDGTSIYAVGSSAASVGVTDGDKGDITVSASGATWMVDPINASGFNGNLATTDDTLPEVAQKLDDLTGALPMGYLSGLTMSNNGTDAVNDLDIAVGVARDATNAQDMSLASALTKRLDATWVVGSNQGGLDTGAVANGTYHVWVIKRTDGTVVDVLFSTSVTSPTMPANYTYKRRIGSIVRAGGTILAFRQIGNLFQLQTPVMDVDTTTLGTTSANFTLASVPTGVKNIAVFNALISNASIAGVNVRDPDTTDPGGIVINASPLMNLRSEVAGQFAAGLLEVVTNTSAQISAKATGAGTTFRVATHGWIDTRDINATTGGVSFTRTGVLRTVYINAGAMIARTTNGAATGTTQTTTNTVMFDSFDFDSTTSEGIGFWWTPPMTYNAGTVTAKFQWTAASGTGTVTWTVAARAFGDDDPLDTATGTAQSVTDTLLATGDMHITATTSALTIAGTPAANKPVYWQITRDVADTLNADAKLLGCTIEYTESATEPSSQ